MSSLQWRECPRRERGTTNGVPRARTRAAVMQPPVPDCPAPFIHVRATDTRARPAAAVAEHAASHRRGRVVDGRRRVLNLNVGRQFFNPDKPVSGPTVRVPSGGRPQRLLVALRIAHIALLPVVLRARFGEDDRQPIERSMSIIRTSLCSPQCYESGGGGFTVGPTCESRAVFDRHNRPGTRRVREGGCSKPIKNVGQRNVVDLVPV